MITSYTCAFQLVWKSTTDLGCGVSQNRSNGLYYIVCQYVPGGNVKGKFQENVMMEKKKN